VSYAAGPTGSRRGGCVRIALVALIAILALGWYVLRAGMTGYGATPLPAGFDVSIEPLGPVAASATPPGVPS